MKWNACCVTLQSIEVAGALRKNNCPLLKRMQNLCVFPREDILAAQHLGGLHLRGSHGKTMDMIKILIAATFTAAPFVFIPLWLGASSHRRNRNEPNVFRISKMLFYPIVFLLIVSWLLIILVFAFKKADPNDLPIALYTFGSITVLSFAYMICCSLWEIRMTDTHLIVRNGCGVTRKYAYSTLTRVIREYGTPGLGPEKYIIFFGKKRVKISYIVVNFDDFFLQLQKNARQSGYKLPKVEEKNRYRAKVPANKKKPKWKKRK